MGPLPRSLATEAHGCFMVRTPGGSNRIQGCGARFARTGGLPSDCSATSALGSTWWRWRHASQVHCNPSRDALSLAKCTEAERNRARSEATPGHNDRTLFRRTALASTRTPKVKFPLTGKAPYKRMAASWSGPQAGPTEYKVAARGSRARAGSPRIVLLLLRSDRHGGAGVMQARSIAIRHVTHCPSRNARKPNAIGPGAKQPLGTMIELCSGGRPWHQQGRQRSNSL